MTRRRLDSGSHFAAAATVLAAALILTLGACGGRLPTLDDLPDDLSCRRTVVVGQPAESAVDVESADTAGTSPSAELPGSADRGTEPSELTVGWRLPEETLEQARLNAWCAAVGPALAGGWGDTTAPAVDTLWVVAWNVHIGGGDLAGLVAELRDGRLTGSPVEHFVLLLQEVHRGGELVPDHDPELPGGSGRYPGPPDGPRVDVLAAARDMGLWLTYVPSMRNGDDEDRGNAILSTLPLTSPLAIGLPVARQRRVALAATVRGRRSSGEPWAIQVVSVHLESSPSGWQSDEEQRVEQAEALLAALPDASASVAAGDYNTKTRGRDEATVPVMLAAYPDTPPFPDRGPTYRKLFGIYREYLDYMFFRLPSGADSWYDRASHPYGSDHFPLMGRVVW